MNVKGVEEVPLEWGGKLVFVNSIVGGSIDARFMPAILKGIMSRMEQGPLTGSYARDVRVIVYDGKMHPVDSNEISFMLAGRNAFSEAFKNAGPKILEPIYDVEVFVPSDKMGDVMGDLQGRRAMIMGRVFWTIILVTTIVGVTLSFIYAPRTWCSFCPMGTLSAWVSPRSGRLPDSYRRIIVGEKCTTKCKLCSAVCPMQLKPYESRNDGNGFLHPDCIKCGRCIKGCPLKVPEMKP